MPDCDPKDKVDWRRLCRCAPMRYNLDCTIHGLGPESDPYEPEYIEEEGTMTDEELNRRFTYHVLDATDIKSFRVIRDIAKLMAAQINLYVPEGREQSRALTKLEEAMMWASAAIARKEAE